MLGYILLAVAGLGSLACWIMVLIKMFKTEKPLLGILGIFCALWTFIWGWMNSTKQGLKQVMLIWTVCIVVSVIGNVMVTAAAVSAAQQQQQVTPTAP